MKKLELYVAAAMLGSLLCVSLTGQQAVPQSAQQSERAVAVPSTANAPEINNGELRPVAGELVGKIDSRSAKTGDPVVIETTEKATTSTGVVIPKGSKILGHVTDVQPHEQGTPNAKIAIKFDQAQLKGGHHLPIQSVLQSVGSTADAGKSGAMMPVASEPVASAPAAGPSTAATGSQSGASAVRSVAPMAGNDAAESMRPEANPALGEAAAHALTVGTVVAHQGNVEIKTTALPGVLIAADKNGQPTVNASGALVGARRNVHLDGGTPVTLAVADRHTKPSER